VTRAFPSWVARRLLARGSVGIVCERLPAMPPEKTRSRARDLTAASREAVPLAARGIEVLGVRGSPREYSGIASAKVRLLRITFVALVLVGCSGPDAAHYEAVLDELEIPTTWELVHTYVQAPDMENDCSRLFPSCPSVTRSYLVDGEPIDAYPVAKQVVLDAGFEIDQEISPDCDLPPSLAACVFNAVRAEDWIRVNIFNPGDDVAGLGIADPNRSMVRLTSEGE